MTRTELLKLLLAQARSQGFEFRKWYVGKLGLPWEGGESAVDRLSEERRYYALLFSHEFACSFWKAGELMTLQVPEQRFARVGLKGGVATVHRRGHLRRRTRPNAWRFHLREMALAEEPLRYARRFLRVAEDLEPEAPMAAADRPVVIIDEEDLLPDED